MKIDRLYTLSQFVDIQRQRVENTSGFKKSESYNGMVNIVNYNEFLKQPLKKEMFINDIEQPIASKYNCDSLSIIKYRDDVGLWQKAEKQVLFECLDIYIDKYIIKIRKDDGTHIYTGGVDILKHWNLHHLSEECKPFELKLKNIEL